MKNIILLGTRHTYQRENIDNEHLYFLIRKICKEYNIRAIAEEIDDKSNSIIKRVSSVM